MTDEKKARFAMLMEKYDHVCARVCENTLTREEWIPAPDGVKLRTIIVTPEGVPGPYSTIVQRSCYFEQGICGLQIQAEALARHGFAVVYQWCRGIGGSEGVWEPNIHDRADGLSLMDWLQTQSWVKNMGYVGASYLAMTGWIMADQVPEKLKTMYLTVYGTERHTSAWREGLFRQDILTAWAKDNAGFPVEAEYLESARYRPQVEVDEALWGGKLQWYRDWITHPGSDDPYWAEGHWDTLRRIPERLKIPVFVGEGWYDHHLGSMLQGYAKLSEAASEHSVLQINPGNHGLQPVIPGQEKQSNAAVDEPTQQIRWFYHILMKEKLPKRSVQYYVIGADEWKEYPAFPPEQTGEKVFFLNGNGLDSEVGENQNRGYVYDPENPVMSHGAESLFCSWQHAGALEQPEPDWRTDVLSFVSRPLERAVDVVGQIQTKLWVTSDAPDTCFTVKVMEVDEKGRAWHIRNGITTLGWRNGATERQNYDGKPVELTISCWDIAWRLKPGSRLRIDISSSNFPEYSVHPNTTTLWSEETKTQKAEQTILMGKNYPSRVILPLG